MSTQFDGLISETTRDDLPDFGSGDTVRVHAKVVEGDKEPFALFARIINTKWYCGDCIYSIKDTVDEIAEAYEAAIEISEAVGNPLRLDPKTGRLVRT